MKISKTELKVIQGGGFSFGLAMGIGALVTFLIGVIDGYVRPLACHE